MTKSFTFTRKLTLKLELINLLLLSVSAFFSPLLPHLTPSAQSTRHCSCIIVRRRPVLEKRKANEVRMTSRPTTSMHHCAQCLCPWPPCPRGRQRETLPSQSRGHEQTTDAPQGCLLNHLLQSQKPRLKRRESIPGEKGASGKARTGQPCRTRRGPARPARNAEGAGDAKQGVCVFSNCPSGDYTV